MCRSQEDEILILGRGSITPEFLRMGRARQFKNVQQIHYSSESKQESLSHKREMALYNVALYNGPLYIYIYSCCCSVTKVCLTLCNTVDYTTAYFPVHHYLPEFAQICVH